MVGPKGHGSIHVDQHGRIRVQFHWDREGKNDESSSALVRMATPWAGNQLGMIPIHRVGSEVVLIFLDGNPDRPLILSAVHNAHYTPPWALPTQQALTGLRSRELTAEGGNYAGGRSNFLVLDDTNQQIQAQLKSDHEHSQLSLGYITRIEGNAGRKEQRGEGWELYSQAWGVARAAKGMLITTEARPGGTSHIKDMGETVQRLKLASERHQALAEAAQQGGAQEAQTHQSQVAQAIDAQNQGIAGSGAADGGFPELAAPHLVLASPAGIETTTKQSTHIASEEHTAITTGKSLSIASGDSFFASIRQTFRLFVHKTGMKLIAAAGDIDMQALSDSINILAKLNITQTANRITITAKEEVVINGGGSYAKYNSAGIEHGTSGAYLAHAANHTFGGTKNLPMIVPDFPIVQIPAAFSQQLCVGKILETDPGLKGASYEIWTKGEEGKLLAKGIIDDIGRSVTIYTPREEDIEMIFGENEWSDIIDIDGQEQEIDEILDFFGAVK